jgi:hypothetical protein
LSTLLSLPGGEAIVSAETPRPFSIQQKGDAAWLVRPNGQQFFSFGVCCVNGGTSPTDFKRDNPSYAAWQHHENSNAWARATLKRLHGWGFTTVGGWSDYAALRQCQDADIVFAPVLHVGSTAGAPWWDMWDPKITDRMEQVARDQILPLRDDPRVIGYYTDNEMGWWNGILFKMTLEQAPTSGQRQRLLALLRKTYGDDWAALLRDFDPAPGIEGWQDLERHGVLFLRPGGSGIRPMRQFLGLLAGRYYSLVHDIVKKYDPRALVLGDRYQSFYYPEVVRACVPYVDALSSNLNAHWNDGTFARFYLDTLHALTGKPVLVGEFYMAARENRSGNQNTRGNYPVAITQKQRVAGFRNTMTALLRTPYVVGADWFQYYDEPTHGRFDGENFNFGLVDIHDRPYEALSAAASALELVALKSRPAAPRLDASQGVPPGPKNPFGEFEPTLALKSWDRERGFVKPGSEFPMADLYLCWKPEALYLGLLAQDVVEDEYYRDKVVRDADRAQWIVSPAGSAQSINARLGAGLEAIIDDPSIRLVNLSGINGNFRNLAAMEIPASRFGRKRFRPGDTIELTSHFHTHCRAYQVEWKGEIHLAPVGTNAGSCRRQSVEVVSQTKAHRFSRPWAEAHGSPHSLAPRGRNRRYGLQECEMRPSGLRRHNLGSTGSLSKASTPKTASCTRRKGSLRTNRSSASTPRANSRNASDLLAESPRARRRSRFSGAEYSGP